MIEERHHSLFAVVYYETRMHSSRMRTVHSARRGGGVSAQEGVSAQGGVCLRGVSAQRGGGVCPGGSGGDCLGGREMSAQGGGRVSAWGEGVSVQGVYSPVHAGIHPPVNRITDVCENITFPQLRCGR